MTLQIYLDNSTTAKPSEKAISAMMPFWTNYWGSPLAPHQKGQELGGLISQNYKTLYHALGAHEDDQIVLTSSGAEAINHVVSSVYRDVTLPSGKNHLLAGSLDEAASILAITHYEALGCVGKLVETNSQGIITPQALIDRLTPRTALLSLSWANGLTGVIQPLEEIAAICKQRSIRLHLDATQAIGKLYYDLNEMGVDYLTINGDQLHAPRGTGLLWIKRGITCSPFIFGSSDQGGLRAGGLNVAALAGFTYALNETVECRDYVCTEIARLRNEFENSILEKLPEVKICFKNQERLPHCTTLIFPRIANEALLFYLNRKNLCASIGGGNFQQLGLMLTATGMDEQTAHSAISFSLSRYTTENEIHQAAAMVINAVQSLKKLSEDLL